MALEFRPCKSPQSDPPDYKSDPLVRRVVQQASGRPREPLREEEEREPGRILAVLVDFDVVARGDVDDVVVGDADAVGLASMAKVCRFRHRQTHSDDRCMHD